MTLARIKKINNYRIFRAMSWPEELHGFGRFNVIYGLNGVGKTTLSTILRCVEKRQSISDGDIELEFSDGIVCGSDFGAGAVSNIRVFNRDFVDKTVFETEGSQFPPVFYFGEDSAEQQRQIVTLTEDLASINIARENCDKDAHRASQAFDEFCTDTAKGIRQLLTSAGSPYNNYDARSFKQDVQELSKLTEEPLRLPDSERDMHLRVRESKRLPDLTEIALRFPNFLDLKGRTEKALALSVISNRIDELVHDKTVAGWVEEGLALHTHERATDVCHFCDQPFLPDRLERLEEHFNDQFNLQKEMIATLLGEIDAAANFSVNMEAPPVQAFYDSVKAEYTNSLNELKSQSNMLTGALDALRKALVAKLDRPFQPMELANSLREIESETGLGGFLLTMLALVSEGAPFLASFAGPDSLKKVNAAIRKHNDLTSSFDSSITKARASLAKDEVIVAMSGWKERKSAMKKTADDAQSQSDLANKIKEQIQELQARVQQHHQPADELTHELAMYLGRSELKFIAEKNGYRMQRGEQVARHLSDGERTAVAFMYFLKSLQGTDFDLEKGIVVIDDPVSSLDANSLFSAFSFMKDRTENVKQLILLTHNFTFFRQVRNWFDSINKRGKKTHPARFFALSSTIHEGLRGARLEALDPLLMNFESEYHYLFKRILELTQLQPGKNLEQYYGIPNMARRVLESFLAYRVPGYSGELYKKVQVLHGEAVTKTRVIRFLHTFSHGDEVSQPEYDPGILSETQAVLVDVLALIKRNDPEHYQAMVTLCESIDG